MTKKKVIGYVGINDLSIVKQEDIQCLDVINLAFGQIREGIIIWDYQKNLLDIRKAKSINPDIKFVLSVGGWGADGFSQAAETKESREKFTQSAVELVKNGELDGIDIDWEYPCIGVANIKSSKEDKVNFTLLLESLRNGLNEIKERYCMLTIAAGADDYYIRCTQMDKVISYLDYVQLMTYDLRGGFSIVTGHHTNLYTNDTDLNSGSVDHAVKQFIKAGIPKEKIIIGAAFYSRMWKDVEDDKNKNGLMKMAQTVGGYGPNYDDLVNNYINKNGYQRFWDEEAKAPYLFNGSNFISYDDQESIAWKALYVKEQELGGIMYWEYKCDNTYTLTKWIAEKIK